MSGGGHHEEEHGGGTAVLDPPDHDSHAHGAGHTQGHHVPPSLEDKLHDDSHGHGHDDGHGHAEEKPHYHEPAHSFYSTIGGAVEALFPFGKFYNEYLKKPVTDSLGKYIGDKDYSFGATASRFGESHDNHAFRALGAMGGLLAVGAIAGSVPAALTYYMASMAVDMAGVVAGPYLNPITGNNSNNHDHGHDNHNEHDAAHAHAH